MSYSLSDDLEVNPFYNRALNKQAYLQQVLCNGSILCVPTINTLPPFASTDRFLDLHILKPSRLYKGEYSTIWCNANGEHQSVSWDESKLTLTVLYAGNENTVDILYSETAYIQGAKYTVLLIDRPLNVNKYQVKTVSAPSSRSLQVAKLDIDQTSCEDIEYFLKQISFLNLPALDKDIQQFKSTYLVIPSFLSDAAHKLQSLAKKHRDTSLSIREGRHLDSALLSYIHQRTFEHIYPHVKELKIEEENKFQKQRSLMQPEQDCRDGPSFSWVSELAKARSPLRIMSVFKLALNVTGGIEWLYLHFSTAVLEDEICAANVLGAESTKAPLSSDDLIPLLIGALLSVEGLNLPSLLHFTQIFGDTLLDFHDALEFSLATFTAAFQYIIDYKPDSSMKFIPPRIDYNKHGQKEGRVSASTAAASSLRSSVLPECSRPFRYSSLTGDPNTVLDRYEMLAILTQAGLYS